MPGESLSSVPTGFASGVSRRPVDFVELRVGRRKELMCVRHRAEVPQCAAIGVTDQTGRCETVLCARA